MNRKGQSASAAQLLLFVTIYAAIVVVFLLVPIPCIDRASLWNAFLVGALAPVAWHLAKLLRKGIMRADRKE